MRRGTESDVEDALAEGSRGAERRSTGDDGSVGVLVDQMCVWGNGNQMGKGLKGY